MNKKIVFERICEFTLDGKKYVKFYSPKLGDAYLSIKNNKYYYPNIEDMVNIIEFFSRDEGFAFNDLGANKKNFSFIPKLRFKVSLILITSALCLSILSGCGSNDYNSSSLAYSGKETTYSSDKSWLQQEIEISQNSRSTSSSLEIEASSESSEDTITELYNTNYEFTPGSDNGGYYVINNSSCFDDILGTDMPTYEDLCAIIDNNDNIPDVYKPYVKDFFRKTMDYYPDLETRVYAYNLKNVKFELQNADEISFDGKGAVAYWNYDDNIIVLNDAIDLDNNPSDLINFRHEVAHLGQRFHIEDGKNTYQWKFNSATTGKYSIETLNVIYSTLPFLDEYPDTVTNYGYGSVTNEMRVIVDCLDYDVSSILTRNIYTLEYCLNNYMSDDEVSAHDVLELIDMHQRDRSAKNFDVSSEDYENLFGYLSRMYIKKYVKSDMSYDEVMEVRDRLIDRLSWGVDDLTTIRLDVVEDTFNEYCLNNGLSSGYTK